MDGAELGKEPPGRLGLTPGSVSCKGSGCTHHLPEAKNPGLWTPESLTTRVSEFITPSGAACVSLGDARLSPHCPACIPDLLPLSHCPHRWSWSQSRAWGNSFAARDLSRAGLGKMDPWASSSESDIRILALITPPSPGHHLEMNSDSLHDRYPRGAPTCAQHLAQWSS